MKRRSDAGSEADRTGWHGSLKRRLTSIRAARFPLCSEAKLLGAIFDTGTAGGGRSREEGVWLLD